MRIRTWVIVGFSFFTFLIAGSKGAAASGPVLSAEAAETSQDLLDAAFVLATRSQKFFEMEDFWKNQKLRKKSEKTVESGIARMKELLDDFEEMAGGKAVSRDDLRGKAVDLREIFDSALEMVDDGTRTEGQEVLRPRLQEITGSLDRLVRELSGSQAS